MKRLATILLMFAAVVARSSETSVFGDALYAIPRAAPVSAGDRILLREVATILNCPSDWEKRVNELVVGHAAQPGKTRILQREEIVLALRKMQFTGEVDIAGTNDIAVVSASQTITGKSMLEEVLTDVRRSFANSPELHLKVEEILIPPDIELRPDTVELQTEWPRGGPQPGTQSVRVRVMQDGQKSAEGLVTLKLRVFGPVASTTASIRAGDVLTEANIGIVQREFTPGNPVNALTLKSAIGLRAKTNIEASQPVTRDMVLEPLIIHRGDTVTVRVKSGALMIAARGEARNDAARGESVRIVFPESDGEVLARATGSREARVGDQP